MQEEMSAFAMIFSLLTGLAIPFTYILAQFSIRRHVLALAAARQALGDGCRAPRRRGDGSDRRPAGSAGCPVSAVLMQPRIELAAPEGRSLSQPCPIWRIGG